MPTLKRRSQINELLLHLEELEKEEITKSKASRRKETTKIRIEINEIEKRKTVHRMNKPKSWFFEKRNNDFPGGAVVENPPANAGDMGSSPGPGRSHMPRSN